MNPSEWRVQSTPIDDQKFYRVYRIRDIAEVDHTGNREYSGGVTTDRQIAVDRAAELNRREVRSCRVCGCTDKNACPGGCYWVEPDLCSRCQEVPHG
jgi:hypothetical protein